jgi:hypothetical protein
VIDYHKRAKQPFSESERLHAAAHVIVENQAALGDATVVPATLDRLMREGLDRHDAIHAIAYVHRDQDPDINAAYGRELAELTAAGSRIARQLP